MLWSFPTHPDGVWTAEYVPEQTLPCVVGFQGAQTASLPHSPGHGGWREHDAPFFQGCIDRPRQKQSLGASLEGDFVSLKHHHKLEEWAHPERCIDLSLLVIQHLKSRDCQVKWYFSPSSPSCISFPFFYLRVHRANIFHPTSPGQGEQKIERACNNF